MKLRAGDDVLVTAGKDKGRKGKIDKVFLLSDRVRVAGLNIYKKHVKSYMGQKGGIIEISRPLPVANVMFVCSKCEKPSRIGYRIDKSGNKDRICKKCSATVETKKGTKK